MQNRQSDTLVEDGGEENIVGKVEAGGSRGSKLW